MLNIIKNSRKITQFQLIKTINFRYSSNSIKSDNANNKELSSAIEIENNLFNLSAHQHEPIVAKEKSGIKVNQIHKNKPTIPELPPQLLNVSKQNKNSTTRIIFDPDLGFEYIRLALKDRVLTNLLTTIRSKSRREKNNQIIIEGRRLINEALQNGLKMEAIIFSQIEQLQSLKNDVSKAVRKTNAKVYKIPQHDMKIWSTLTTPPGVMAIFERPNNKTLQNLNVDTLPITVVCDNIREPNNLGSIIRSCAALPCHQIIVTNGCCDPWESKALRGGCGGHFRIAIHDNVPWVDVPLFIPPEKAEDYFLFIAENNLKKLQNRNQEALEFTNIENIGEHNLLIIGGESHGVSRDAYNLLQTVEDRGKCLYIPLADGIESLNVASALTLILYELRKHATNIQNKTDSIEQEQS